MDDSTSDAQRRDVALVVRLTRAEREELHAAARAAGWPRTGAWVRAVAQAKARSAHLPDAATEAVVREVRRMGNNLNQLSHAMNAAEKSGKFEDGMFDFLGGSLVQLSDEMRHLVREVEEAAKFFARFEEPQR